jgi:hypothetical protein
MTTKKQKIFTDKGKAAIAGGLLVLLMMRSC